MEKRAVVVVLQTREYGGPEEGGWWYDAEELLASRRLGGKKKARRILRSLRKEWMPLDDPQPIGNVNSAGKVRFIFADESDRRQIVRSIQRAVRPHYE